MQSNIILDFLSNLSLKYSPNIFKTPQVSFQYFCEHFIKIKLPIIKYNIVSSILGTEPGKWNTKVEEIYLLAGKGAGKDMLIALISTYLGYWLKNCYNPQKIFGIPAGSPIEFANVSINARQAKDVYFKYFKSFIKRTVNPETGENWFKESGMDLRDGQDIQTRKVIFSPEDKNNITAYCLDSQQYTGEGLNLLFVVMDEVGAFRWQDASNLYEALTTTSKTRFKKFRKLVLISYKYDDNDYMQYRWKEAKDNKKVLVLGPYSTWDLNPTTKKEDFEDDYVRNPQKAKRIYECTGENLEIKYFNFSEYTKYINKRRISPIKGEPIIVRSLKKLKFHSWFKGNFIQEIEIEKDQLLLEALKKLHSNRTYHIHIDLALGRDKGCGVGFGMAHRIDYSDNNYKIYIDLMMEILGRDNKKLNFEEIRTFIIYLKEKLNFNIKFISLDGYQSEDFLQIMTARGFTCKTISVDKTKIPYETLQGLLYEGRLNYYDYPVFRRELYDLEETNNKIDHPKYSNLRDQMEGNDKGSKDVADSIAGVSYSLIKYYTPKKKISVLFA